MGEGIIVAVLDNGIDPCHVSYTDDGMPPPARQVAGQMAPRAHLASYEVCFEDTCPSTKQLIAIEQGAFVDGVDVISISPGDDTQKPFYKDLTAVGSFSTVMSGVFVSTSAGNSGSDLGIVTNCVPHEGGLGGAADWEEQWRAYFYA
ncbi:subtilisin-like protease SBT1.7 [Panicum miliaceum]|uniref:Subtilisin-like protease SBT1.7 n=1 Tax=Panicum miliaceum TaxID=4540 RepID=A0A3L6QAK7_PANMI|nr:subtilisin-like protease SBT1.7 [Panicum miliaceum]